MGVSPKWFTIRGSFLGSLAFPGWVLIEKIPAIPIGILMASGLGKMLSSRLQIHIGIAMASGLGMVQSY